MYKAGFVGLIGQPNAGKSSLMNFLVNEKVSIVTRKPQTTRRRILGITNREDAQIIFIDAPGIVEASKGLNGFLAKEAKDVIEQSDVLLAVLSLDEKNAEDAKKVVDLVSESRKPWIGVVTKVDLNDKIHRLLILKSMIESKNGQYMSISSVTGKKSDRDDILNALTLHLPESPQPLYDVDLYTNESVRQLSAEIVREKCFEILSQEIPYGLAVRIIHYDETSSVHKIYVEILVAKESHQSIVIGKKAEVVKKIGTESRHEIEKILGHKIFLDIKVAYKENWQMNKEIMKELGYVRTDD